ncbi:hypothetical protein BT96DRAFT_1016095 [Gymnopus androsaceus JB14]|uniref:Uncharacterized protein n=1 Tax=Gymnopus androsaceus JB14 TaxID=1447944 RepID=A0A6A4I2J6_9AGAR|nr:hypothetical protein BT96DRAFT_1016095 [Gymnopus androsaceus JB14]
MQRFVITMLEFFDSLLAPIRRLLMAEVLNLVFVVPGSVYCTSMLPKLESLSYKFYTRLSGSHFPAIPPHTSNTLQSLCVHLRSQPHNAASTCSRPSHLDVYQPHRSKSTEEQRNIAPARLTMERIKRLHAHRTENSMILTRWVPGPILDEEIGTACLKSVELKVWGRLFNEKVYRPLIQVGKAGMKIEMSSEILPLSLEM